MCVAAEGDGGDIVLGLQGGQAVGAVVLGVCRAAVVGGGGVGVVGLVGGDVGPGVVVAVVRGLFGTQVDLSPQQAAGQSQVDPSDYALLELGRVGNIAAHGDGAGVAGVAVAPAREAVPIVGRGADADYALRQVGAAALHGTHRGVGGRYGDGEGGGYLELGGKGGVAAHRYVAGVAGVAVGPLLEPVPAGGGGAEQNVRIGRVGAAARHAAHRGIVGHSGDGVGVVVFADNHLGVARHLAHVAAAVDVFADGGGAEDVDVGVAVDDGRGAEAAAVDGAFDLTVPGGYAEGLAFGIVGGLEAAAVDVAVDDGVVHVGALRQRAADDDGDAALHRGVLAIAAPEDAAQRVGAVGIAHGAALDVHVDRPLDGAADVGAAVDAAFHLAAAHHDVHLLAHLLVGAAEDLALHGAAQDVDPGTGADHTAEVAAAVDVARDVATVGDDHGGVLHLARGGGGAGGIGVAAAGTEDIAAIRGANLGVGGGMLYAGATAYIHVGVAVHGVGAVGAAGNPAVHRAAGHHDAFLAARLHIFAAAIDMAAHVAAVDAYPDVGVGQVDIGPPVLIAIFIQRAVHAASDARQQAPFHVDAAVAHISRVVAHAAQVERGGTTLPPVEAPGQEVAAFDVPVVLVHTRGGRVLVLIPGVGTEDVVGDFQLVVLVDTAVVVAAEGGMRDFYEGVAPRAAVDARLVLFAHLAGGPVPVAVETRWGDAAPVGQHVLVLAALYTGEESRLEIVFIVS